MYTKVKNIQILIALLKAHKIQHIVISAGSRHVPFAQSVENDSDFTCYSVVDERSAGYYAIGLIKALHQPVAIVCTSSTATCNYYPAVYEASRQNLPLLVLTADRHPAYLNQMEDQMIAQPGMYGDACRKSVTLPWITSQLDSWQCQRLVNEALLELQHHGSGPVQINFPNHTNLKDNADLSVAALPNVKVINRYEEKKQLAQWKEKADELRKANRILVLCGSGNPLSASEIEALELFSKRYNCVIATEKLSNIHCEGSLDTYKLSYALNDVTFGEILPEIVISFGGNFYSRFKALLRGKQRRFRHWSINESGEVVDVFQSLTSVFESSIEFFFRFFAEEAAESHNSKNYYKALTFRINKIKMPELKYSSLEAIYRLSQAIPENSLLHLSILNSTRILQLFDLPANVRAYSNLGTFGIDGSMSTFLGQAAVTDQLCFLIVGDLSFFYDINSTGLRGIKNNVRILLINNGGAAEFHFSMGQDMIPTINKHIAAEHSYTAERWLKSNGFEYMLARNSEELEKNMKVFTGQGNGSPMVLEVITQKECDAQLLNELLAEIKLKPREIPDVVKGDADKDQMEKMPLMERLITLMKKVLRKGRSVYGRIAGKR